MTFTDKMCAECYDSGATDKNAEHGLDCRAPGCEAVSRRMAFDNYLRVQRPGGVFVGSSDEHRWAIYKHVFGLGVEAGRADLAKCREAIDGQIEINNGYLREIDALRAAQPVAAAPDAQPEPLPQGWRATLAAEKAAQERHYGEVAACASTGNNLYASERDMTEGVIKGVEYCIAHLEELAAAHAEAYGRACMALRQPGVDDTAWVKRLADNATGNDATVNAAKHLLMVLESNPEYATAPVSQPAMTENIKVDLELPEGDTRTVKIMWQEVRDGKLCLAIKVSQPAAQEPIYQVAIAEPKRPLRWYDVLQADYDTAMLNLRRIVYTAPQPLSAPAGSEQECEWKRAQRICDLPDVDEAIRGFAEDQTNDNAVCLIRAALAANEKCGAA